MSIIILTFCSVVIYFVVWRMAALHLYAFVAVYAVGAAQKHNQIFTKLK